MGFEDEVAAYRDGLAEHQTAAFDDAARAGAFRSQAAGQIADILERAVVLLLRTPDIDTYRCVIFDLAPGTAKVQKKGWFRPTPKPSTEVGQGWCLGGFFLDENGQLWDASASSESGTTVERSMGDHGLNEYKQLGFTWGEFVAFNKQLPTSRFPESSNLFLMPSSATLMSIEPDDIQPVANSQIRQKGNSQFTEYQPTASTPQQSHFAVLSNGQVAHVKYDRGGDGIADQWTITELETWLKQVIVAAIGHSARR